MCALHCSAKYVNRRRWQEHWVPSKRGFSLTSERVLLLRSQSFKHKEKGQTCQWQKSTTLNSGWLINWIYNSKIFLFYSKGLHASVDRSEFLRFTAQFYFCGILTIYIIELEFYKELAHSFAQTKKFTDHKGHKYSNLESSLKLRRSAII